MKYTDNYYSYHRRETIPVQVGEIYIGGNNPIRIQSMTNTNTLDTAACIAQCERMIANGCELIRITTPSIEETKSLKIIHQSLKQKGYHIPLIADVHFSPKVAEIAAEIVEKVRINPGNYADKKQFKQLNYTDQEYNLEIERIAERLYPLLKICKTNGTAIRIGTNHGSLSDRIVSRYGNSPMGMAISAMEYVTICNDFGFHNLVLSMKSSDTRIMVESVRCLVALLNTKGWHYPLHLGITEAGNGEYGRIKSAGGIGALLNDGIGDTIRVSLTESPENELPFAKILTEINNNTPSNNNNCNNAIHYNPFAYQKRITNTIGKIGGNNRPIVISKFSQIDSVDMRPDKIDNQDIILASHNINEHITTLRLLADNSHKPLIFKKEYFESDWEKFIAHASADIATLGLDGLIDAIWIINNNFSDEKIYDLSLNILQACGLRYSKAEFISCPSCGRTQYNIEKVATEVQQATAHLKGLKIGIMGCIVNGPGEMADADFGVVGSGKGKVTLYKGQTPIERNIDQDFAAKALVQLIQSEGKWHN